MTTHRGGRPKLYGVTLPSISVSPELAAALARYQEAASLPSLAAARRAWLEQSAEQFRLEEQQQPNGATE